MSNQDDPQCKFKTYMGNNLAYKIFCETACSDNEEKEGDDISGNCLINLKTLTTNIEFFSVPTMCTGDGSTDDIRRGKRTEKLHIFC